jgi:phosphate:Na+ symporter
MLRGFAGFLRVRVGAALKTKPRAFVAGLLATLALQSSTATGLMAASFMEFGLFGLTTGLAMMLGSNVGTALVAKLLSFPIINLVPLLLVGGVAAFRKASGVRGRSLGRVAVGLALMLWALHDLGAAALPMTKGPLAQAIIHSLQNQILASLVIGIIAAWAFHTSVAVVLVIATLAATGTFPPLTALSMVLGANLGSAIGPYLETKGAIARRLPLGNLVVRGVGVLTIAPLLPIIIARAGAYTQNHQIIVDFHVLFNIAIAIVAWPFSSQLARLLKRLLPDPPALSDPGRPEYLEEGLTAHPHLAMVAAERESVRLGANAESIFRDMQPILFDPNPILGATLVARAESSAKLAHEIRLFIDRVARSGMGQDETRRSQELQAFALGAEQAMEVVKELGQERRMGATPVASFLGEPEREAVARAFSLVLSSCREAIGILMTGDIEMARALIESRDELRAMEREALHRQLTATQHPGVIHAIESWVRTIQHLRHIHSYWTGLAHQVLEEAGLLRGRLRAGNSHQKNVASPSSNEEP